MRTIALVVALIPALALAAQKSPISSRPQSGDTPEAVAESKVRGAATAAKDIKAGVLRILYWGKPWSARKALVDDDAGYRVQVVAGCSVSSSFKAEVEAYNSAMRAFHAEKTSAIP